MARNGERPEHRVVVTGMGVLAPNGNNLAEFWDSLIEGRSGLGIATSFDVSDLPVKTVAELKNFDPRKYMDFKEAKRMARFSQVGVAAAKMAIDQSGLELAKEDRTRIGCEVGTGIGGFKEISEEIEAFALRGERGPDRISPFFVPRVIPNMASCQIAIQFGLEGPNNTDTTACAASTQALGNAYRVESAIDPVGGPHQGQPALRRPARRLRPRRGGGHAGPGDAGTCEGSPRRDLR
jgi:3-oxoacyl-[acyl-carrier-protein] synthase II